MTSEVFSDCGICQGTGWQDNEVRCLACNGDGITTYPEYARYAVEVTIYDVKVIWVEGESPRDALHNAQQDPELYEEFSNVRSVDGWWEVADRPHMLYADADYIGPIEKCENGCSPPVSQGKYGHKHDCPKHPPIQPPFRDLVVTGITP